jgi:hypothetical protein
MFKRKVTQDIMAVARVLNAQSNKMIGLREVTINRIQYFVENLLSSKLAI